jgi:hypothetical protein
VTTREERVARNEAVSREINEGLEQAHADEPPDRYMRMYCECGQSGCENMIAITASEYERVRSDPVRFVIVREHLISDIERVVEETDRFVVIAKREGTPAQVAREDDPRS